ncbi:DUF6266 family protein [Olivibacter jilunii]|uniref:DUF6266 family protein n=1 Tax=Olivibacter jilunii TaxID=985016 RepID=UPI003F181D5C
MGRYVKGANGAFSGKVGSVVGSSWRSINYLRSLPKITKKGASEAQIAHRTKFAISSQYLRPLKDILNIGFSDQQQAKSSGYNMAVRAFFNNAIIGEYPDFEVDFSKMELSRGSINPLPGLGYVEANPGELSFTWQTDTNKYNAFADDAVLLVIYNQSKRMYMIYDEASRADGTFSVAISINYSGDVLHAWGFALHRNGKLASTSQYLGTLTVS